MVMYNSFVSSENGIWNPDWYIFLSKTLIFVNCAVCCKRKYVPFST